VFLGWQQQLKPPLNKIAMRLAKLFGDLSCITLNRLPQVVRIDCHLANAVRFITNVDPIV